MKYKNRLEQPTDLASEIEVLRRIAQHFGISRNYGYLYVMAGYLVGAYATSPRYGVVRKWVRELPASRQWWIVRLSDGVVLAQNRVEEAR